MKPSGHSLVLIHGCVCTFSDYNSYILTTTYMYVSSIVVKWVKVNRSCPCVVGTLIRLDKSLASTETCLDTKCVSTKVIEFNNKNT